MKKLIPFLFLTACASAQFTPVQKYEMSPLSKYGGWSPYYPMEIPGTTNPNPLTNYAGGTLPVDQWSSPQFWYQSPAGSQYTIGNLGDNITQMKNTVGTDFPFSLHYYSSSFVPRFRNGENRVVTNITQTSYGFTEFDLTGTNLIKLRLNYLWYFSWDDGGVDYGPWFSGLNTQTNLEELFLMWMSDLGTVDISACTKLRKVSFEGTPLWYLTLPSNGGQITNLICSHSYLYQAGIDAIVTALENNSLSNGYLRMNQLVTASANPSIGTLSAADTSTLAARGWTIVTNNF